MITGGITRAIKSVRINAYFGVKKNCSGQLTTRTPRIRWPIDAPVNEVSVPTSITKKINLAVDGMNSLDPKGKKSAAVNRATTQSIRRARRRRGKEARSSTG